MIRRASLLLLLLICVASAIGTPSATAEGVPSRPPLWVPAARPLQQTWTAKENLANTPTLSRVPEVAVTENGTVHVVWEEDSSIYHTFGNSGAWSTPAEIVVGDSAALAPGSGDEVHMAYVAESGGVFDIFYTRWEGSSWTVPVNVSRTSGTASAPAMAFVPGNTLHIVWADDTGGETALYHGQSSSGSAWTTFLIPNGTGSEPAVAANTDGALHVAWQSADPDTGLDEIWHTQFSAGAWSLPENISAMPDEDSTIPVIALTPANTVHIVWQEAIGPNMATYHASGRSGDWSAPDDVSGTLQSAEFPALSIDAAGNGFLLWDEGDTIMGRGLDGTTGVWSTREEVAGDIFGISDPAVFLHNGTAHAAWAEEVSDLNWDIFSSTRATCNLVADVDGDNDVDIDDVAAIAARWHASGFDTKYDLDEDGTIDIIDIMLATRQWGASCQSMSLR